MSAPLALAPPHTIRPFRGPIDTVQTMLSQIRGPRGEQSVYVRSVAESIVRGLTDKCYLSEILAVRNWVATRCRYANDPATVEFVRDPQRMCEEIAEYGRTVVDCDEMASLIATLCQQLGREAQLVVVGFGRPGVFSHVFARVEEPKTKSWVVCDPVAGINEGRMLRRVKTWRAFPID